jgi:sugar-specific transcriptional regulator TrmB
MFTISVLMSVHTMLSSRNAFKQLGFSRIAEVSYLALLQRGACSVADLAKRTGKHRPAVYKAISELLSANMITRVTKGKRLLYKAESPSELSVIAKRSTEAVDTSLPELLSVFHRNQEKPNISFFEGKEGIATAYEQLLSSMPKGEAIYRYESPEDYSRNKRYYPSLYWKRAGSDGDIDKYVITNKKTHDKRHVNINRLSKAVNIPFENNITQIIGNGKVIFIDYTTETSIMIENDRFADFQKSIFKMFFERL